MVRALLNFTPALSKGLIAKGVATLPQVRKAFENSKVVISTGSTTSHIYRELVGKWPEGPLACGMVTGKGLCVGRGMTDFLGAYGHAKYWYFEKGAPVQTENLDEVLAGCTAQDVFIKGANAIDFLGHAGVLLGMENGGTLGKAVGHVMAKGMHFVIPVGLEKTVKGSVSDHAREMGIHRLDYCSGMPVGLMPIAGKVVTEIEAMVQIASVEVYHIAAGGVSGGEGSVALLVKGEKNQVGMILDVYDLLRKEVVEEKVAGPAKCADHRWEHCAAKNINYAENVKKGK
ncbi:MAG: hypothetical protein JW836_09120 [Deltaproteobacteria bacterium]|nr:hypothetical protein [Deltaproteobacteria bacterium]